MENTLSGSVSDQLVEVITTDPEFACPGCGFEPGQLLPPAAAAAARSFGRRWRELLTAAETSSEDRAIVAGRCDDSGWSPLARATRVALVLDAAAGALNLMWLQDRPVLALPEAASSPLRANDIDDVFAALTTAGEYLARRIENFGLSDWDRVGIRDGHAVTALHLVREAIHEAVHQLRLAADGLQSPGAYHVERDGD